MATEDLPSYLLEYGVALLQGAFPKKPLAALNHAAVQCFNAIETGSMPPEQYRFSRSSHSVLLASLREHGCSRPGALTAPISSPVFDQLFFELFGDDGACNLEQSWVRKKFAPCNAPAAEYHLQNWHQDGALGVHFPADPGPVIPMTELLTCWIPLNPCGVDSPGLEFIHGRQPALLHFTELDDLALRRRFPAQDFSAPAFKLGDGLVFLGDVLHRTFVQPGMQHDRLSVEYRIFPN